jgi:DNA-binding GntR family transcriptional regulator
VKSAYKRRDESDEHKQVVDAVVAGNVAAACAALTHHYEKTAQIILSIE